MNLESEMREMMVGQNDAVEAISQAIRRARTGMRDPSRPIGSFIFAGPTGVGKSQLAKALCTSYFGSEVCSCSVLVWLQNDAMEACSGVQGDHVFVF